MTVSPTASVAVLDAFDIQVVLAREPSRTVSDLQPHARRRAGTPRRFRLGGREERLHSCNRCRQSLLQL